VTQRLLNEHRGLVPGVRSTCRVRLAHESRTVSGSAACSPGSLRHLSPLVCACLGHRTPRTGSALPVRPFAAVAQAATTASADFCPPVAPSRDDASHRRVSRSPGVRRVTFAPYTRRIYALRVRVTFGLRVFWPPRPPSGRLVCASCSSGRSFAHSFLPTTPRDAAVAVRLGVPVTWASRGLSPPSHFPARFPLPVRVPPRTPRAMPSAPKKCRARRRGLKCIEQAGWGIPLERGLLGVAVGARPSARAHPPDSDL
jgi:hypothetical protein